MAHILLLLLLIAGIIVGVYLVQNRTNLLPKAAISKPIGPEVSFSLVGPSGCTAGWLCVFQGYEPLEEFGVKLYVRSDIEAANLFTAKMAFPKDLVEVKEIKTDASFVKNWVENFYDNNTGDISLVGGVPSPGLQTQTGGESSLMATIVFRAKAIGKGTVSFTDSSAILSNLNNINILTVTRPYEISVEIKPSPTLSPTPSASLTQEVKTWLILYKERSGQEPTIRGLTPAIFTKQILLPAMTEGSRFHGYSNPSALPALRYTLSDTDIHTENNPRSASYSDLFNKYNLCAYAKANNISTVIIWADGTYDYGSGEIRWESAITGNKGISTNGPILSGVCDKTIVIYAFDYTRDLAEALESYGHHLERVFGQFRPEYYQWSDKDSCGTDHNPPNARFEYDRSNTATFQSDCRNWKPNNQGIKETLSCTNWGCDGAKWLSFWMQNMPGVNNELVDSSGQKIPNWWVYIGDPDRCYNDPFGCLVAPSPTIVPTPTPSPTQTPVPTTKGDGNSDGKINLVDMSVIHTDWMKNIKSLNFREGIDMNSDGVINTFDYGLHRALLLQLGVIRSQ